MSIDEVLEYFLRMRIHNNLFKFNQYFENHVVSLNLIRTTERLSINELPDAYDRYQSRNLISAKDVSRDRLPSFWMYQLAFCFLWCRSFHITAPTYSKV